MTVLSVFLTIALSAAAPAPPTQAAGAVSAASATPADTLLVEAACGQCRFGLPGKGCDLAVRVGGRAYFVAGTGIDGHGDAHAKDGFCNAIRQARVQGTVADDKFNVRYFQLLPATGPQAKP